MKNFNYDENVEMEALNKSYGEGYFVSHLTAHIKFKRLVGFYVTNIYIPTALIVALSWTGFWLRIDAVPARISLGVLTVFAISAHKYELPQVNHAMAIHWWHSACLILAFATIVEYAFITWIVRRHSESKILQYSAELDDQSTTVAPDVRQYEKLAQRIDCICRWVFPLLSCVLFIAYWCSFAN